jgi:hypothetical protein
VSLSRDRLGCHHHWEILLLWVLLVPILEALAQGQIGTLQRRGVVARILLLTSSWRSIAQTGRS